MATFERIVRGGTAATGSNTMTADVGVKARRIAALGLDLGSAGTEIDARGKLVLAGGIDSHVHIAG
jgi:dihydropyrimidinase